MSLAHWIVLDSHCTDTSNIYCFSKHSNNKPEKGYFAIIAEELPQTTASTRSQIGAKLLVDASQLALTKLQAQELNFAPHFFHLLNDIWKAKVFLHAIQNPFLGTDTLSVKKLTENDTLSEDIVRHYDVSAGIIYLKGNQLVFLQSGDTQLALLNKRNNCEIKKVDQPSLSVLLNRSKNTSSSLYQLIDIKKHQLEMVVLLPHKYTAPKTSARLKSNILKIYRTFESNYPQIDSADNAQLTILKKDHQQKQSASHPATKKPLSSASPKKQTDKKSMTAYVLSTFLLLVGAIASYFLWQAQAKESISMSPSHNGFIATQMALNNTSEAPIPLLEVTNKQSGIKKQTDKIKRAEQKKREEVEAAIATEKARLEKEKRLQLKQKQDEAAIAESLRIKTIEKEKARKEKELQERRKLEAETKARKLRLEQEKKLKQQQEEAATLLSIEKDLDLINQHDEKIRAQQQAEEQKRRENQTRLLAEKQAEAKRKAALIQQRRREFENNKNNPVESSPSKIPNTAKSREEQQIQIQKQIKQKEAEKQRIVAEELKRQQAEQIKAKEARNKVIQKTITHQLLNYSKTFHRHVVQLQQKNKAIELLERRKTSSNDPNIVHKKKMLQSKKNDIEQRIDRLSVLYASKLKELCANKIIHPIAMPTKLTKVERIAYAVISQKLRHCSQPETLSSQNISKIFIKKYLK